MIKTHYYHLIAGLPDLFSDEKKPPFTSVDFRNMLQGELSATDFEAASLYYLPYDHKNLLNLLFNKKSEWDERGNYPKTVLEVATDRKSYELAENLKLHNYIDEFLKLFYNQEKNDSYQAAEALLTAKYYDYVLQNKNSFIRKVAENDIIIWNVMTTLSSRKHNIKYDDKLIGNNEINTALIKSRARDFGITDEVDYIEKLVQIFEIENLVDREYKLDVFIWNYFDDITFFNYFTIEKIIAYIRKLFIAERWYALDKETGRKLFNKILKEISAGFVLPDEFRIKHGKNK